MDKNNTVTKSNQHMSKNHVVTKSNHFIMNSSYDLSLEEQKLILTLASMVQPDDEEFKPYVFKISEFMKLLGVENQAKYTEIPKMTKELMKKVFEIEEGDNLIQTAWLSGTVYKKGTGYVVIRFNPDLKPYMIKLNSAFTKYKLGNILSMKSKYSPRIYEILKCNEFKKQKYVEIEVSELRKLLKAEKIYPKYNDFKRKIIIQSQKELLKRSDISFEFDEIKTGRKVTSIKFYIYANNKLNNFSENNNILPEANPSQEDEYKSKNTPEVVDVDEVEDVDRSEPVDELTATLEKIMILINNITGKRITGRAALAIFKAASRHKEYSNDPIKLIDEVAHYSNSQQIATNFVGWFVTTVEKYERPQRKNKKLRFDNFKGRDYSDIDDLEKKLLGWDTDEEDGEPIEDYIEPMEDYGETEEDEYNFYH